MSNLLKQADAATEVAREAFAAGDTVTGIAAIQLAAQLVQLAKLFERPTIAAGRSTAGDRPGS